MKRKPRYHRPTKLLIWMLILGILGAGAVLGIRRAALGVSVDCASPRRGPLVERIVLTGRVISPGTAKLGVAALGIVASVDVDEGSRVSAGQPLLHLKDDEQQAAVAQARAAVASARAQLKKVRRISGRIQDAQVEEAEVALDQAKRELARAEQLAASGAGEQSAVDGAMTAVATASTRLNSARARADGARGPESRLALARVDEAQASLAAAEARLNETVLRAPSDGVVLDREVEPGDIVQPGQILFVAARDGALRLEANADEKNLSLLSLGQRAEVVADGYPDTLFPVRLGWISPAVDGERGTVTLRFDLETPVSKLKPDMTVSINLEVSKPREATLIPISAVRDEASDHPWVLVIKDGRARRTPVLLGARDGKEVEVLSGIDADAVLVNEIGIADGAKVRKGEML